MFYKLFIRSLKILWGAFATTVVLLAVVISVLKYSLPHAHEYRQDIEQYLFEEFDAEIQIGGIDASWRRFGPVIILRDVQLAPSPSAPLDISIAETRIELDFWQSISQQKMVTSAFQLDGVRSRIDSAVFFKVRPSSEGSELFESLSHLFLSQVQQFKILDSFIVVDHSDGESQDFQLDNLTWVNDGNRHQGQGEVYVDGFSTNSMNVIVDLYGQRRTDIFGQIYFEAKNMDVTPWLRQLVGKHIQVKGTDANFAVWGEIKNGLVENILLDINHSKINWQKETLEKYLNVESATVQWWKSGSDWLLFGNEINIVTDVNRPNPFNFSVMYGSERSQLQANNMDLSAATQLFSLFSATKELSLLADSDVAGQVGELQIQWGESLPIQGYLDVVDFDFVPKVKPQQAYIGLQNLALKVYWQDQDVWLNLLGENGKLLTHDTFSETIAYQSLQLQSLLSWSTGDLHVKVPKIKFKNDEVNLDMALSYSNVEQGHLSLYAEIEGPSQGKIKKYLPQYLLGAETYEYLTEAIKTGRGELTQVLIDGRTNQLFDDSLRYEDRGRFVVVADLTDGIFEFSPSWPSIEGLNAILTVENDRMTIDAKQGEFSALTIDNNVQTSIPLVGDNKHVLVALQPNDMAFKDFHLLIEQTPLKDIIGDVFEFVQLDGTANANITIDVPIDSSPDENGVTPITVAKGQVFAQQTQLNLPQIYLQLNQVDATINFENEVFQIANANGDWQGIPVEFNVFGKQGLDGYQISSDLTANWSVEQLAKQHELPLFNHAQGAFSTVVTTEVNIDGSEYQFNVDGKTDLTQVEMLVSGPLKKPKGQYSSLDIAVFGDDQDMDIWVDLDKSLWFQAALPEGTSRMEQALLTIGREPGVLPLKGFDIYVKVPELEFEPTLGFVLDLIESLPDNNGDEAGLIDSPKSINGTVGQLNILGQNWQNVSLKAASKPDSWLFSVGAQQTLTDITVFNDIDNRGILIDAQFLQIETEQAEEQDSTPSQSVQHSADLIRGLPPIQFKCEVCSFNDKPLGKVNLVAKPKDSILQIEKFTFEYERTKLDATGAWYGNDQAGVTELKGKLYSRYFGKWLQNWGLNSGIKESDATINLSLNWDAAPYELIYEKLNGKADFKLGEGYLSEVSDQGARIFSLFSLDSLYRKLKFDFSDVFAKGLFYNDVKGDIILRDGVALTDNIKMDGVAGDMNMAGQTDLAKNTLDYNVSFKPKVTSSLPAIAAWFAPADGGLTLLAAIALDKIIENAPVVSEIKFKIYGDLSEPKVQEVERFTRTVKLPEEVKQRSIKGKKKKKPAAEQEKQEGGN